MDILRRVRGYSRIFLNRHKFQCGWLLLLGEFHLVICYGCGRVYKTGCDSGGCSNNRGTGETGVAVGASMIVVFWSQCFGECSGASCSVVVAGVGVLPAFTDFAVPVQDTIVAGVGVAFALVHWWFTSCGFWGPGASNMVTGEKKLDLESKTAKTLVFKKPILFYNRLFSA
ncbi:Hypothetical predicted protein [Octopus vulgaris]|uniref:Uncharacterized protein n=1 Tax=Octopus vulgaris TaxID=6645 RepID=A0AA36AQ96_OCTVU|nr:Hypothetical predicted protein [Octopus vulgaris]